MTENVPRPRCNNEEDLIRAIPSPRYCNGRVSPDLFKSKAVSVNRLLITDLKTSLEIFRSALEKPAKGVSLSGYATVQTGELIKFVADFVKTNSDLRKRGFTVWVEAAPTESNQGHAEIMPNITEAISFNLVTYLEKEGKIVILN